MFEITTTIIYFPSHSPLSYFILVSFVALMFAFKVFG